MSGPDCFGRACTGLHKARTLKAEMKSLAYATRLAETPLVRADA